MRTTFVIKRIFEQRLPAPYSNCQTNVTGSKMLDDLKKTYYQSECLVYCQYYFVAKGCGVLDEFLEMAHTFYTNKTFFQDFFWSSTYLKCDPKIFVGTTDTFNDLGESVACKEICPIECNSFSFSISEYSFKLPNYVPANYAELLIFYETFEYTIISQSPKITEDALWGTIGGLVGLFLGATFLSLGELLEFVLSVVTIVIAEKRNAFSLREERILEADEVKYKKGNIFRVRPSLVTSIQKKYGILINLTNRRKVNELRQYEIEA